MIIRYFVLSFILICANMGCVGGLKKTEKSSVLGTSTNLLRFVPGYRSRRLKNLDFYIETESKELKRQQIAFDSRVLRKKLIELDK